MKKSKTLVGLLVGILSLVGIVAIGCGDDKSTGKKPVQPTTQGEWGVYYYDYNGSEYLLSLADGNKVTAIMGNAAASGKYVRKDNDITFTYTSDDLDVKSAKINADNTVITLTYNNVSMAFLRRVMYNVTFNTDSGSEVAAVEVLNGKSFSRPNDPVRDGYTFLGWYKDSEYKTPFIFESDIISANTTLYAQWGPSTIGENVYTVSFDVGEYDGAVNPQSKQTVGGKLYNLETPVRNGYTFVGWWYSVTGKADELTYRVDKETVFSENTTLYAVWQGAREGDKLLPPAVSVEGNRISWDPVTSAAQYRVQVQGPQSFVEIDRLVETVETTVAFNTPGDYTVTVTAISSTGASNNSEPTVRTYKYNPLAKVSLFNIVGDTLLWSAVDNAEKYVVKVDCGNKSHNHDQFDNGQSTYFNFANCEMQDGGIKFTVTAVAEGYTSSVSEQFVYNRELAPIAALNYDEDAQTVSWKTVPYATNYVISFNCGTAGHTHTQLDLGNKTSYCIKECAVPAAGLKISVTPYTKGYNSPGAAELTVTAEQKSLATPFDLRIIETTLSWSAVTADKYVVRIGDKEVETTTNSLNLAEQDVNWTKGSDYNIRVKAVKGDKSSPWSDVADARYFAMYSTLKYNKNTVSWRHVIGAQGYEVRVNEGGITRVTDGTNFARVRLTAAGDNKIEVRFFTEDETSAWAPLTVNAYALTIDTRGGLAAVGVGLTQYYAIGDEITLPTAQQITKEGYTLGEFYTTPSGPDGNGSRFTDKTYTAVGDTVVYASWVPNTYKIKLNYNNGGTGVAEYTVTYGKPFRLPTPDTIKDGTTVFGGWCANSLGTAASYTDENGNSVLNWTIARDTEVFAKWLSVYGFEKVAGGSAGYYYMLKAGAGVRPVTTATIPATYKGPEDSVAYPVTQIGMNAFGSCQGVEVINLPSTIDTIQPRAFESYTALREINVYQVSGVANDTYFSDGGVLYYNNATVGEVQLWAVPRAKTGVYTLSDRATEITSYAFYRSALEEVRIPASVKFIENNAFNDSGVATLTFLSPAVGAEATPLRLEEDALYYAKSMTELMLPARPIAIVSMADGKALTDPDFNTQVFRNCSRLTTIKVDPASAYYQSVDGMLCTKGADATILFCPKNREGVLTIPMGIVKIGRRAFSGCLDITEVRIPNWVTEIGEEAFSGYDQKIDGSKYDASVRACTSLEKVTFLGGDGVAAGLSIGKNAFGNKDSKAYRSICEALDTIEFMSGSGVAEVGEYAFARCPIANIILPATLEELKEGAFYGCELLTTVEYAPNGKNITVGDQVFANCTGITTIKLPANITQFNDGVFAGCNKLANIEVDPNNPALSDIDGVLFSKDQTVIIFYPAGRSSNYSIPATVTEISGGAFSDKENITDITIGKNVTKIGAGAFRHCVNLETVTFEDGGTAKLEIGESAFNYCTSLTSFKIPSRVTEITDRMLMNTYRLTELEIPDTITSIGRLAFANLAYVSTIEKIAIPASVGDIGVLAFYKCGAKKIEFEDKETGDLTIESPEEKISSKTSPSDWLDEYFPETLEIGQSGLFQGCSRLQKITLPKGLKNMPAGMFKDCSKLDEVVVPGTVTKLGNTVFAKCASIKTITFAEREIDAETGKPLELVLEDGYKTSERDPNASGGSQAEIDVYYGAFAGTGITSIELPEGTTRIPDYAFGGCASLVSVTIPTTVQNGAYTPGQTQVTAIGTYAFSDCPKLTTLTFTPGGTGDFSLGAQSFYRCTKLTSITLPARLAPVMVNVTWVYSGYATQSWDTEVSGVRTGYFDSLGGQNDNRGQYVTNSSYTYRSFYYCPNLAEINVAPGGTHYASDDGVLYTADKTELVFIPYGRTKEVKVPYTVSLVRNFSVISNADDKTQISKITFLNAPAAATTAEGDGENQPVAATELRIGEPFPGDSTVGGGVREKTHESAKQSAAPFSYSKVSSITLPDRLSYIGEYAFYNNNNLTSITLPDATTTIGDYAFYNAQKLKTFTIKETSKLNYVGEQAFAQTALTSIYLPPAKTFTLGSNIFLKCTKLTRATIPNTITKFDGLFTGAYALSDLNIYAVKDENGNDVESSTKSEDGIIFLDGGKTLSYYPAGRTDAEYTIPVGVTSIAKGAFNSNGYLKKIIIPNTVSFIGDQAFYGCASVKTIEFEKDDVADDAHCVLLTDEEKTAYKGTRYAKNADGTYTTNESGEYKSIAATTLTIGESTSTTVTDRAHVFAQCVQLETVHFPARLESLAKFAFYYCPKLTTVTFDTGSKLGMIRDRTFLDTSLQYGGTREEIAADPTHPFVIPASVSTIEAGSAGTFGKVKNLVIPAGVTTIGNYAFADNSNLESIEFKGAPSTIGTYLFRNCTSLTSVKLPSGCTTITSNMFLGCIALEEIALPSTITKIDSSAFSGCTSLTKVVLPASGLTTINGSAFLNCSSLAKITYDETNTEYDLYLPSSVTTIAAIAFANTAIETAFIPGKITTLNTIFGDKQTNDPNGSTANQIVVCSKLKKVVFDQGSCNATTLPSNMFLQLPELEEVVLPTTKMTTINAGAFAFSGLKRITIPANITKINLSAFANCPRLEYVNFAAGNTELQLTASSYLTSTTFSNAYRFLGAFAGSGTNNGRAAAKAKAEAPGATAEEKAAYAANYKIDMSNRNIVTIPKLAFCGLGNLDVVISKNTTKIDLAAFLNAQIETLSIPASVTTIEKGAFAGCTALTSVKFENSTNNLTITAGTTGVVPTSSTVNSGAFVGCSALTVVDMSERNIVTIPNYTFYGCGAINDIKWSERAPAAGETPMVSNTTTIGNYAFRSAFAPACTTLNLPEGLTSIGTWAFNDTALKTVTLPSTLTTIGERAFSTLNNRAEYTGLTCAITIPGKVATIGNYAFADTPITGLTFGTYKDSNGNDVSDIKTLNTGAFYGTKITSVIIPASMETIGRSAFYNTASLERVTFADGSKLKTIDAYAFRGNGLTGITIPKSVTTIGNYAFAVCPDLETVTFEKGEDGSCGLTVINEGVFCNTGLTAVSIPKEITSIGNYAFQNCESLATVTFEKGEGGSCDLATLGSYAFNNTGLIAISAPKSVTSIGDFAFADCSDLATVTLEKGEDGVCSLTSIGAAAFRKTAIISFEIPKSVMTLGANPFRGCADLTTLTIEDGGTQFTVQDNVVYSNDKSILYVYAAGLEGEFTLPDSVVEISDYAFSGSKFAGALTVTKEGFTVGYSAFYDCGITGVSLGNSAIIGAWAFEACSSLTSVTLGESATVNKGAFSGCQALANVVLGANVKVGSQAFKNCEALTTVTLPTKATVDYTAFDGSGVTFDKSMLKDDTAIKYVYNDIELTATIDGALVFDDVATAAAALKTDASLEYVILAEGITQIANNAFKDIANLKKIKLPSTLTKIGTYAFQNTGLVEIVIPKNVEFLLTKAFYDNQNLETVIFEKGSKVKSFYAASTTSAPTTTTDSSTFANCSKLTSVTLPDGLQLISRGVFQNCTSLTSISIPATVEQIGMYAFDACTQLEEVIFEKSNGNCALTTISTYVFKNTKISSVSIPATVTTIGQEAFRYCASLTSVTFEKDSDGNCALAVIGNNAFEGNGFTSISLPKSFRGYTTLTGTTVATAIFQNCESLTSVTFEKDEDGNCTLTTIGGNMFRGTGLSSIVIPKSIATIGANAFDGCASLTSVTFEKDADGNCAFTYTGNYAFANTGLTSITLPKTYTGYSSGTTAATYVFQNCASLTTVTFEKDEDGNCAYATIGNGTFNNTGLTEIDIPQTVTKIGDEAFRNTKIESVIIPASVTGGIGTRSFADCANLTSVVWANVDGNYASGAFGQYTFENCPLLRHIPIPATITLTFNALNGLGKNCTVYFMALPGPIPSNFSNTWLFNCEARLEWYWSEDKGFLNEEGKYENKVQTPENTESLAA